NQGVFTSDFTTGQVTGVNPYMVSSRLASLSGLMTVTGLLPYIRPVGEGLVPSGLDEVRAYCPQHPCGLEGRGFTQVFNTPVSPVLSSAHQGFAIGGWLPLRCQFSSLPVP